MELDEIGFHAFVRSMRTRRSAQTAKKKFAAGRYGCLSVSGDHIWRPNGPEAREGGLAGTEAASIVKLLFRRCVQHIVMPQTDVWIWTYTFHKGFLGYSLDLSECWESVVYELSQ